MDDLQDLSDAEEMQGVSFEHGGEDGQDLDRSGEEAAHPGIGESQAVDNMPMPGHLKDISSLASWTVSTYKPGCGVAALRHSSPLFFWQSDGPQPHVLNIHFFKLVAIAHMRVYLDFELDESYTPTKLQFFAGTGHHDLQNVCEMALEEPKGWLDVNLTSAGGPAAFEDEELDEIDEDDRLAINQAETESAREEAIQRAKKRRQLGCGSTLRCFLVQLRILENHQNGKDTHLRGLQIFARDETAMKRRMRKSLNLTEFNHNKAHSSKRKSLGQATRIVGLKEPSWSDELEIR